jgi:hypothetical protein
MGFFFCFLFFGPCIPLDIWASLTVARESRIWTKGPNVGDNKTNGQEF